MTKHSDTRRDEIIKYAAYLFRKNGFEKTTVRELADLVGIKSGSLFHYFKTKNDILIAIMEETIIKNRLHLLDNLAFACTPQEKLYNLIKAELDFILGEEGDAASVLTHEWRYLPLESKSNLLKLRDKYEDIWIEVLNEVKAIGLMSKDVDIYITRRLIYGAIVWTANWYNPDGRVNLDSLTKQVALMIIKDT